ncbi:E3 ubiquitin-protein ligase listerin [Sesamum angolense]|uniref:E3 ubiquitin-protein ligase listerin n=1 Tax=Sesamum angolense TaxID=2727404 RepID=A0AAE1XA29_9LAMI|nr:E3 ubiquitin-protein ligase listerin [Sesamum angolense]
MGRAKGEAARAKSRPSSSSMAASLLPSGVTAVGFGGYVGSSRVDSSLASAPDASPFLDIDGEVAQHLKRLSRKDPTTKVLSSSLLALAALLDVFFSWHSDSSATENVTGESKHVVKARTIAASAAEKLFSSHKYFLDFLKSQSPAIRSAAYSVVRSFIKNIPHAISEGDIKVLAGTILGSFQEKNPACHSSMWDTFLLFTKSFPESWHAVNVQKTILSRLWNFLRNGCFGSQQVSYPALVLFLEIVPSEAITGDKFFLEFFHSLWAGRSMSYSSNADRLAFFLAVEECFIWGLRNSSRYCEGVEAIYHFQHTLINEILLGLLWHEYLLAISPKYQEASFSSCTQGESKNCIQNIHKEPREAVNSKHSMEYEETLGKCVIKILSQIHCLKHDLLSAFSLKFQADCLDIFQETEYSSQNVLWVVKFIFLLDKYAVQKGETWPLLDLVGPALKKSFPLIETLVNVLVAWCLLLSHIVSLPSSSPARERMIQYVQDSTNTTILDCLFQHIPLEVYMGTSSRKKDLELPAAVSEAAEAARRAITTGSVLFSVELLWPTGPEKMASLAGAVFGLMLHNLPAYVRGWFSDIRDRSLSSAIESFTKAWCSPTLISNELSEIKKASFADDNFSVSVSKSANEVVATYTKDETGMDLVIRLPPSYPLRPVDVDCTRSLGISEVKRRKWLMSLMSFVRNQNGALAEAIRIWKSNFDKEFEGVEECPICYSVIHTVNHSLPRLACKTCKHKFHSACLYKWFSTSHKSTCPLCQSPF